MSLSQVRKLNRESPTLRSILFGDKLKKIIALINELRTDHGTNRTSAAAVVTLLTELKTDAATNKTARDKNRTLAIEQIADQATNKTVIDELIATQNEMISQFGQNRIVQSSSPGNGAGLAMATMDGIKLAGGSAANFLDVGGSSDPHKVLEAMQILLRNEQLRVILINIFGGITRCDDVAQGILWARDKLGVNIPMVIRLIGTNEQKGRDMLCREGMIVARSMTEAIADAVNCARRGVQQ